MVTNQKTLNILIIEDNPDDAYLVTKYLERAGIKFTSTAVMDRDEIIAAIQGQKFDLILCDNSVPRFSAQDALDYLKVNKINTPLIVFSGTVTEEYALDMINKGAQDYIDKDHMPQLIITIKKVLARQAAHAGA